MIAIISYVETPEYDREIQEVLGEMFFIDEHYYIKETPVKQSHFIDVQSAVLALDGYEIVNVQRRKVFERAGLETESLKDFRHPEDACYIFGPNYGKPVVVDGLNVSVDVGKGSLHAVSVMAMVLYDRVTKGN